MIAVPHSNMSSPTKSPPLREIPGGYGLPIIGPLLDRFDYFYVKGFDAFFRSRVEKHKSTVFRTNMPPGPGLLSSTPNVIAVLDSVSFSVLFDSSKVDKSNTLAAFVPSLAFTGGYRLCAHLDPTEPSHHLLKSLFLTFLASRAHLSLPVFRSLLSSMFTSLDSNLTTSKKGTVEWGPLNDDMSFEFVFRLFSDAGAQKSRNVGPKLFNKLLFCQLAPEVTLSPPNLLIPLEDLILHTLGLPAWLVKSDYNKLYTAFWDGATSFLDKAEETGIARNEACHNLVFLAGLNAFAGMKAFFPTLIKWVASGGESLHRRLRDEIRGVVGDNVEDVTVEMLERMRLTKSVVYEALRMEPPVPFQFGRVKEDMLIQSHDASFMVKKGELLCGYQLLATRDPRVFDRAEEFVGDRFVGEDGEKLLNYVYWSNGRENDDPTPDNKQCPGKNLVLLMSRLLLVDLFLRYDTFQVKSGTLLLASTVTFLSLTKAT